MVQFETPQILLVCGSRDYTNRARIWQVLGCWKDNPKCQELAILHGDASGADSHARAWATQHCVPQIIVPADFKLLGRSAGPLRNQQMLDWFRPNCVLAFPKSAQWSPGTRDMINRAIKRGTQTIVYTFDGGVTIFNAEGIK